jgi:hypothetical protein
VRTHHEYSDAPRKLARRGLAAALTVVGAASLARLAGAQSAGPQDPQYQVVFVPILARNICIGDQVVVRFSATYLNSPDQLASLVPPERRAEPAPGQETFVLEATGGTITPSRVRLAGASEVFTARFRAAQAGPASITVRAVRGTGSATRSFTIQQHCDFRVQVLGRTVIEQQGVRIEEVFVARGTLNRVRPGTDGTTASSLAGDGTVWARADMSNRAGPVSCRMDPLTAHGTFESTGTINEGDVDFSLNFGPITIDTPLVFRCTAPGMQLNMPLEISRQGGDANRLGLRDLTLGAWGGSMSFAYGPATGVVTLSPR